VAALQILGSVVVKAVDSHVVDKLTKDNAGSMQTPRLAASATL